MCGVCGLVSFTGREPKPVRRSRVEAMVKALTHRGPDDTGMADGGGAIVGATRLAIRGLHDGRQPIVAPELGVIVVCNGEIDNHRELRAWLASRGHRVRSSSDIDVLPALYREVGDAWVERLVGAFAIAIWDSREQRLLLARDGAGERHLFSAAAPGEVSFATELAALAAAPSRLFTLDLRSLGAYLRYGSFDAPSTPFAEARKVGPGEIVTIDEGGVTRRRYWRWQMATARKREPSADRFNVIFREAVRRQSDVDVPYGIFLSGGIDSSLVAAVARSIRPDYPLAAYTLRFDEPSYDEGSHAERVAERLGISCVPVRVRPEALPTELADLIRRVGEPLADPAWIPTALLARRAAAEVKLAFIGEGADELFGGYPTYIGAQISGGYGRLPGALRALLRWAARQWPASDKKVTLSFLLKAFLAGAELDGVTRHLLWTSNIPPALLERLGVPPPAPRAADAAGALLDLLQQYDAEHAMAEGLLIKTDRGAMTSALELRAPFLDRDVIEFAAMLPVHERVRGITTKVFLKRFASRYLPRSHRLSGTESPRLRRCTTARGR